MRTATTTRLIANGRVWSGAAAPAGPDGACQVAETAIVERDGRIAAVGALGELQRRFPDAEVLDAGGRLVTPGFID